MSKQAVVWVVEAQYGDGSWRPIEMGTKRSVARSALQTMRRQSKHFPARIRKYIREAV